MIKSQAYRGFEQASSAPTLFYEYPDSLGGFRRTYCALVVLATILQWVFFHDADNWYCVLMASMSSLVGLVYSLDTRRFQGSPISCLMLMLFTTTSTSGALLVKTLDWTPLVERLQVPGTTFKVLFGAQVSLIAAHAIYLRVARMQSMRSFVARRIYLPARLFQWPTDTELWLLGLLGCASLAATGTDFENAATFGAGSAGVKLLRAFSFLKFAPFLIPFRHALSGTPSPPLKSYIPLMLFFGALVILSFATNSRSTFADSVPIVGICVLMATAYNAFSLRSVPAWKIVATVLGAVLMAAFLSRVALAMVVVRDLRANVDFVGLIQLTFEALTNSEWLEAAKARMTSVVFVANYSEEYVNSSFLARFVLTKYHDNILYYSAMLGPDHMIAYRDFITDRLWATFPDPILRILGIAVNKEDLVISNGDFIVYMIDGWGLGGFKTGSMVAEIYFLFGWLSPVVLMAGSMLLFIFYDAMVTDSPYNRKVVSPLIILLIWNLCGTTAAFGLSGESLVQIPAGIVRNLPQSMLFYWIAVVSARFVARAL